MAIKPLKRKKVVLIILILLSLMLVRNVVLYFIGNQQISRIAEAFNPYVKESFSAVSVPMPENPFFVLYNMDKKIFSGSFRRKYPLGTDDPEKANAVIAYQTRQEKVGNWIDGGNRVYSSAYAAFVDVYVIRLSDWALIEKQTFQSPITKPDENKSDTDYVDMLAATKADKYIQALLEGKSTESVIPRQTDAPAEPATPAEMPDIPDVPDAADLPDVPDLPDVSNLPDIP